MIAPRARAARAGDCGVARRRRVRRNVPLAPLDHVQGRRTRRPVRRAAQASEELVRVLDLARDAGVPVTLLGGGSNVLVADRGVRGLVVRPRGGTIREDGDEPRPGRRRRHRQRPRAVDDRPRLRRARGVGRHAGHGRRRDLGNAHWADGCWATCSSRCGSGRRDGGVADVAGAARWSSATIAAGCSARGEVLLSALFALGRGEPAALRAVARESLAYRKRTQPLDAPSAGCIFQNPAAGETACPTACRDRRARWWIVRGSRARARAARASRRPTPTSS